MQERLAASGSTQERLTASRLFKERDVEVGLLEEGRGRAQTHGGAALLGGLLEELRAAGGVLDERLAGAD
jgi:hypothetical protein